MRPQRDLVVIEADKPKEKTKTGIYLVEEWKTLPPTGKVVAIGPEVKSAEVGDRVLFERYGSVILENNMRICKESHVMAKLEDSYE